jgi:hypothetical protein
MCQHHAAKWTLFLVNKNKLLRAHPLHMTRILAYVKAAGPDGERTAALLPFPPKGTAADGQLALAIPLRILHHGCSFSGN